MAAELAFDFPLPDGLHARPASLIRERAESFRSAVRWTNLRSGIAADARSALALIATDTLGGDPVRIAIEGPDEAEARRSLRDLIEVELPKREAEAAAAQAIPAGAGEAPRVLLLEKAVFLSGLPAGPGVARAAAVVHDPVIEAVEDEARPPGRSAAEEAAALETAAASLEAGMRADLEAAGDRAERDILRAHLAIVRDPVFLARARALVEADGLTAAAAEVRAAREIGASLHASRSPYLRQRLADVQDVTRRLVALLRGRPSGEGEIALPGPSILVAEDLPPSRFLALDRRRLAGLVLESAGLTSHTLILCRARGIPAVAGLEAARERLRPGEDAIIDGGRGLVVPSPSPVVARYFEREAAVEAALREARRSVAALPGRTADGRRVEIAANIGDPEEMEAALAGGAEGIGLFRTEFLLFDRTAPPGEDEQTEIYARVAKEAAGRPVIVRTFDLGGDKPVPYLPFPEERNPFLGLRGVRTYDLFPDLLHVQLRAILRAAVHGPLKIMVPMVGRVEEMASMRARLDAAGAELAREGVPHRAGLELGMMVEIPAAALLLDRFAAVSDFFSVGTNDLLQYAAAADRGHPGLRPLLEPAQPAFLRLLRAAVDSAHAAGRWIGLCGEMGGDVRLLPLLVGLGFDELSMAPAAIPAVKARLRELRADECRGLLDRAAGASRAAEVLDLLNGFAASRTGIEIIAADLVRLGSVSRTKAEAIQELAAMMEAAGRVDRRAELEEALWKAEDVQVAELGFRIAFPHCKSDVVRSASVAFLKFDSPVEWGTSGGFPADMAIMFAFRSNEAKDHLQMLKRLSISLVDEEFRDGLRAAGDPAEVIRRLSRVIAA